MKVGFKLGSGAGINGKACLAFLDVNLKEAAE